jgi:hypothetical protein
MGLTFVAHLAFIPPWVGGVLVWLFFLLHFMLIPSCFGVLMGMNLVWNARLARPRGVQVLSILGGLALIAAPFGITAVLVNVWSNL